MKKFVFQVNYEYTITEITQDNITLNRNLIVPIHLIKKNFVHNFCRTCHSFQGSSIDDAITIFDWKFVHVDRKWIYTSITRATDLKKGVFPRLRRKRRKHGKDDAVLPKENRQLQVPGQTGEAGN
jgi:hypothetical protein